jgi:predicted Zn finger-like uncharacterized protein
MSLATRCSACGTVFRVQQDQLKASEGWVRCGRCGTVFSALEGLFDLERESHSGPMPLQVAPPAPAPTPARTPAPAPSPVTAPRAAPRDEYLLPADPSDEEEPDDAPMVAAPPPSAAASPSVDVDLDGAADEAASAAAFAASSQHDRYEDDSRLLTEHSGSHTFESRPIDAGPSSLSPMTSPSSILPSFLRESDQAARWQRQRPVVRRLTIAAAVCLPLVLGLQVVLHHRDVVAARWPGSAELLRAVCAPLECTLRPPRSLESLSVEASGLTKLDGVALYRLQVAVRNRASWPVAMPAFDLTLTDPRGDIVSRRMLSAAELGGSAPTELAPGAEWSTQSTLDVGDRRVTGYAIDLFYP